MMSYIAMKTGFAALEENRWYWDRPTGRGYTVLFEGMDPAGHELI